MLTILSLKLSLRNFNLLNISPKRPSTLRKKCPHSELSKCGKMRTRITPNTGNFYAFQSLLLWVVTAHKVHTFDIHSWRGLTNCIHLIYTREEGSQIAYIWYTVVRRAHKFHTFDIHSWGGLQKKNFNEAFLICEKAGSSRS